MRSERLMVPIYDLSCGGGGALAVERALARVPGVARAYVNPATETVYVEYDADATTPNELVTVVNRAGFRAGEPVAR